MFAYLRPSVSCRLIMIIIMQKKKTDGMKPMVADKQPCYYIYIYIYIYNVTGDRIP